MLEAGGFRVARMEHFLRPTPLEGGPDGLADWMAMFGGALVQEIPAELLPRVLARMSELATPALRHGDRFVADYRRLRFLAVAETGGGAARPAKLHRQTNRAGQR